MLTITKSQMRVFSDVKVERFSRDLTSRLQAAPGALSLIETDRLQEVVRRCVQGALDYGMVTDRTVTLFVAKCLTEVWSRFDSRAVGPSQETSLIR